MINESSWRRWKWDSKKENTALPHKKMAVDKAYDLVVAGLKDGLGKHPNGGRWYAEKLADELGIVTHVIKQVFHKLNLEGKSSQAKRWQDGAMHTRNDMWGDDVVQWEASWYNVYEDKL